MYYKTWLDNKTIIDGDWPLSVGWQIKFCSINKLFTEKKYSINRSQMREALGSNKDCEGMAAYWNKSRIYTIAINYDGNSFARFNELINHEISHIVDYIFQHASIKLIDTELRAYIHDWILGKVFHLAVRKLEPAKVKKRTDKSVEKRRLDKNKRRVRKDGNKRK
jgi:predicted SprT family Zn-dependent metalloprotease